LPGRPELLEILQVENPFRPRVAATAPRPLANFFIPSLWNCRNELDQLRLRPVIPAHPINSNRPCDCDNHSLPDPTSAGRRDRLLRPRRRIGVACAASWIALLTIHALNAAEFRELKSEPGVSYKNDKIASEPWSIHVLRIDRSRKDLALYSTHANDKVLGVSLLVDQARAVPRETGRAIAAINGDFYLRDDPTYAGDPRGLQIINGELISGPDTVCVWIDPAGNLQLGEVKGDFNVTWPDGRKTAIGLNQQRAPGKAVLYTPTYGPATRARGGREFILEKDGDGPWLPLQVDQTYRARVREVRPDGNSRLVADAMVLSVAPQLLATLPDVTPGATVQISTATMPDLKGAKGALGGGPALIQNGKSAFPSKTPPPGASSDWTQRSRYERHPRSAVGWNPTHIYLVVVDGRQPRLSAGMKLAELAEYMQGLGCTEAMNLDGGKSAQLWANGQILNSPCQGEDTVANSLLVLRRPESH
jgi:hypothetical protein